MADVKKRYDWSYYSTISTLPDGISSVSRNGAVVLNNEIHVIFEVNNHYKWTGSSWEEVSTLPYNFSWGSTLVLVNNEIHALGLLTEDGKDYGKGHYAWDGQNWREVSVLPDYFKGAAAVVYNGEIHLLGGNNASSHIKFNGSSWEEVSTLPEDVPWCQAIVWGGKIHVFNSDDTKHWAFDGSSWAEVSTLPYYTGGSARIVIIDDEIHIFSGGDDWYCTHYRWDGTKWIDTSIIPYYLGTYISPTVAYNGVIYGISDNAMYSIGKLVDDNDYDWDDIESLGDLPYDFVDGCVLKYNDEIHILGSSVSGNERKHYKYDGSNFYEVSTLPYPFYKGNAVIFNGVINILGGEEGPKNWYKFNGTSWESSVELPFDLVDGMAYTVTGHDYNDLNDEQLEIVVGTDKYAGINTGEEAWSVYGYYTIPVPVSKNSILFHNLQEHLFSGTYHYKYDGVWWLSANKNTLNGQSWDTDSALPYDFHNGAAVSINGDIHILGSDTSGNGTKHYSWNSSTLTWEEVSTLPYDFHNGAAVAYNDEIYIFGGTNNTKGFTKIGSIVKPDPPTPPTPPEPPVPDTDYDYLDKEGLKHLIDLIKSDSVSLCIASFEKDPALYKHSVGETLYFKDGFYKVTTAILEGDEIALGSNIAYASLDAGTAVYIWGFPNKDETYNAIYIVNEDGTGTEYANNLSGNAEPVVDKTYTVKFNLNDQNPDTWCTRVEGNVTEIEPGVTENEIDDFMAYYPCMLLEGIEGKRLNPDNYAQDLNGVPVDIESGSAGDVMVKFPSRGYKISKNGDEITVSITKERNKTGYTYPTYNGKSVKSIYESAYEGYVDGDILKSLSSQNPTTNKKIGEFRDSTIIHDTSDTYYDWDNAERLIDTPLYAKKGNTYAVDLNGEIHILGGQNKSLPESDAYGCHYKWNGSEWEEISQLPCTIENIEDGGWAVVINDEIHICGLTRDDPSELRHFKWTGTEWQLLSDNLISSSSNTVVYNNEIISFKYDESSEIFKQYRFDGTSWSYVCDVPNILGKSSTTYNGSIYNSYTERSYIDKEIHTTELISTMPYDVFRPSIVVLNDEIHVLGGIDFDGTSLNTHYKWNGTSWEEVSTLPYKFDRRNAVVYHGEIHIIGGRFGDNGDNLSIHYKWNGSEWEEISDISSFAQHNEFSVVYNDAIYTFGKSYRVERWNGIEWEDLFPSYVMPEINSDSFPAVYDNCIYTLYYPRNYEKEFSIVEYNDTSGARRIDISLSDTSYTGGNVYNLMVYNNKLCVLIRNGNFVDLCDIKGTNVELLLKLPRREFDDRCMIIFNNELHALSSHYNRTMNDSNRNHYKFLLTNEKRLVNNIININSYDGISWNKKSSLDLRIGISMNEVCRIPGQYFVYGECCTAVLNDELYMFVFEGNSISLGKCSSSLNYKQIAYLYEGQSSPRYSKSVTLNGVIYFVGYSGIVMYNNDTSQLIKNTEISSGCPFNDGASMIVFNNEIHILGGENSYGATTKHYKWDGSAWVEVSTLPYKFYNGSAVVYNNEIHILGSGVSSLMTKHYKWDGSTWSEASTLPYDFYNGSAVVYNNEIHILGSNSTIYSRCHYKYDGSKWSPCEMLPLEIIHDGVVVMHDKMYYAGDDYLYEISYETVELPDFDMISMKDGIHMLCDIDNPKKYCIHLKYDEDDISPVSYTCFSDLYETVYVSSKNELYTIGVGHHIDEEDNGDECFYKFVKTNYNVDYNWDKYSECSPLPIEMRMVNEVVIYNNEFHLVCGTNHYKYNGSDWELVSTLPYEMDEGCLLVLNNELHAIGLTVHGEYGEADEHCLHYKYDGSSWVEEVSSRLPYDFVNACAIVLNGEIHILGSGSPEDTSCEKKHYKWNGTSWEEVSVLPYEFSAGCSIVLNGEIHILGGILEGTCRKHFVFDGVRWNEASTIPYDFYSGNAIILDGEIHIFGSGMIENGTKHYKWDGSDWSEVSNLPYEFYNGSTIEYHNEVYILGGSNSANSFIKIGSYIKSPYEQFVFNVLTYLQCCAIIKYKGKNIQQVLGMGYTYNNSTPLPTGTMNTKGLNWGEGSGNQGVKLFGIENFYGNLDKYVDGICIDENSQIKVADGDFNDTGEGYTNVGQPLSSYRVFGFLKEILGITNGGFVSNGVVGGSDSTYFCDFTEITTNKVGVYGGNLNSGSLAGLTNLSLNVSPEDSQPLATARLTYFNVDED